jgi:hypothetical protein
MKKGHRDMNNKAKRKGTLIIVIAIFIAGTSTFFTGYSWSPRSGLVRNIALSHIDIGDGIDVPLRYVMLFCAAMALYGVVVLIRGDQPSTNDHSQTKNS